MHRGLKPMNQKKLKTTDAPLSPPRGKIRDLLLRIDKEPEKLLGMFPDLSLDEQMSLLLFAPGELRQELLLTTPHARQLVSMLPVQEVFFSLKEIGLKDAAPLLSLMTPEQLQYVSDMQIWEKDLFNAPDFLRLLQVLQQCGEDKFAEWLANLDVEVLALALMEFGWVTKFNVFDDAVETSDTPPYISYEGYYRFHFKQEELRPLIEPLFRILHTRNPEQYAQILESAYQDVHTEIEEAALQFRDGRLCDRGIPGFEDAQEIYQPLPTEQFHKGTAEPPPERDKSPVNAPLYPVRWLPEEALFRKAFRTLAGRPEADFIRFELASLGNKVVVADRLEIKNHETLKWALKKVSGYLTIGLEHLAGKDVQQAATWILNTWLSRLFRVGYTQIHELNRLALNLKDRCGFRWIDRFHYLADAPLEETFRGLFRPRPLFFEGISEYNWIGFREFVGLEDVQVTKNRLQAAETLSAFFSKLDLSPENIKIICLEGGLGDTLDMITWSQALHTLWARRTITDRLEFRPLSLSELDLFRQTVFSSETKSYGKKLSPDYMKSLLRWFDGQLSDLEEGVHEILRNWIACGIKQMEQELGGLPKNQKPDPRFIRCLCLQHTVENPGSENRP